MAVPELFVFDVDGTLIDFGGAIAASTLAALASIRSSGIPLALATGRPTAIADVTLDDVGGADWMVCGNGSVLFEVATGKVLRDQVLPDDVVAPAIVALRERVPGVRFAIEGDRMMIAEEGFGSRVPEGPTDAPAADALAAFTSSDGKARRLIAFHPDYDERLGELAAHVQMVVPAECSVNVMGLPLVDVAVAGDHKAVALQELVDHLGIAVDRVVAFGDGRNDVEMLQWAGHGIAMGNASLDVQAVADAVAPAITDGGIAPVVAELLAR